MAFNVRAPDLRVIRPIATKRDFDREEEAFAIRKQSAGLERERLVEMKRQFDAEQGTRDRRLGMEEAEMAALLADRESRVMEGKGYDAQVTNKLYQTFVSQGMDPKTAEQQAIDTVLQRKTSTYMDPETGQVVIRQGRGVFNSAPAPVASRTPPSAAGHSSSTSSGDPYLQQLEELEAGDTGMSLYDAVEAGAGTKASAIDMAGRVTGNLGLPVNKGVTIARQKLRNLERRVTTALSISGRPPVFEQQLLRQLAPETGFFESAPRAHEVLKSLQHELLQQYRSDKVYSQRQDVHVEERKAAKQRMEAVSRILEDFGGTGGPPVSTGDGKFKVIRKVR